MQSPQILVVGSGPAGLALALSLLKNGVAVRIIERDARHHVGERGPGVMPRTLEIEHFLGVADDVRKAGMGMPTMHVFDPKDPYRVIKSQAMVEHVEETPAFPVTHGVMLGQWRHQAILRAHIEALGGTVELGTALVGIEQDESGATAEIVRTVDGAQIEEKTKYAYIVGADGARSAVRKTLGLNFVGETREEGRMYIVDARVDGAIEGPEKDEKPEDIYLFGDREKKIASLRHTAEPGCFQMFFAGPEMDFTTLRGRSDQETIQNQLNDITQRTDLKVSDITWQIEWRPNIRMAERFHVGRVFIIGDAAHAHSPTGGQGLNSSIQDAVRLSNPRHDIAATQADFISQFNLAWKLALVVQGRAPPALLDSYEVERVPVIAAMLKITTDLFDRIVSRVDTQQALARADASAASVDGVFTRGRNLFQLDLNYRWSTIVHDERYAADATDSTGDVYGVEGHDVRAGDRAPDAPGLTALSAKDDSPPTRLFDVFRPSAHTALVFLASSAVDAQPLLEALQGLQSGLVRTVLVLPAGASRAGVPSANVDLTFEDTEGHAFGGYGLDATGDAPTVVLVRPDGMVGAFARSAAGIKDYLSAVYGSA
ncbi:FAD binding domain-containing protein [Phellopilus nigrolimitatus]|nr:FAD binding domain-containing protein [Phellopilus nigrolimitatus]